jgi:hypothetical protein
MQDPAWIIRKPSVGRYTVDVLGLEDRPLDEPAEGELRVRTIYLSLDPSNLMWLKLLPGWMEDVRVGDVMKGPSIAVVERSRHRDFAPGDIVTGPLQWRRHSNIPASAVSRAHPAAADSLEANLSIFSHVGRAALIGMMFVGRARPNDVVLVSGAAGATGSLACQIAKAAGARVIGIAGGPEKCAYLARDLGLHAAIDYRKEDLSQALAAHCPTGFDVFFDNVGGALLDAALMHLRVGARVAICGAISQYSNALPPDSYRYGNLFQVFIKRARIEGFVVPDFAARYDEIDAELARLVKIGALHARTHVLSGLEQAAAGLELLLTGGNHGKLLVAVDSLASQAAG